MKTVSPLSVAGWSVFLVCCAVFAWIAASSPPPGALALPAIVGWLGALVATRPMVVAERRASLYFAFGFLALMLFFIDQTYGYEGRVRNFPLIIGYAGVVLALLDIVSLTTSSLGTGITRFFGSHLDEEALGGRSVSRELIVFAAMGGCVLGIWLFGFLVFSPIFVLLWMLAGGKSFRASFYGGIFTLVFIYLMFEIAFQYELYRGAVFLWLMDL